jgi:hypothetical protein
MRRRLALAVLAIAGACTPAAAAAVPHKGHAPRTQTKIQAEIHVLSIVTRSWPRQRLHGLVNPRTHALATNTQAVCSGRGYRKGAKRFSRFSCVIRPRLHRRREGLYVTYRVLPTGGARVHWVAYRRR